MCCMTVFPYAIMQPEPLTRTKTFQSRRECPVISDLVLEPGTKLEISEQGALACLPLRIGADSRSVSQNWGWRGTEAISLRLTL